MRDKALVESTYRETNLFLGEIYEKRQEREKNGVKSKINESSVLFG